MLFASAFPLAPLLALLNNLIEIHTDSAKFLLQTNRPDYEGSSGIGVWYVILEVLGAVAVITNCCLIAFSQGTLFYFVEDFFSVFAIAVILEHILLFGKYLISILIPDIPKTVQVERARATWLKQQSYHHQRKEQLASHEKDQHLSHEDKQEDDGLDIPARNSENYTQYLEYIKKVSGHN
jgi:hypothetical protein